MPKVSVIVPCYNSAGFIGKCLKGLEDQTFRDMDIIVIDDCSVDNTFAFLLDYQKKCGMNVTLLQNEKNSGPAQSRNKGIQASNAEYVAFCDSDDWYEPEFLEVMVNAAQIGDADMVFCNFKRVFDSGKVIHCNVIGNAASAGSVEEVLTIGADALHTIMVRRAIVEKNSMPDIRNGEDMAVLPLLIASSKRFAFVPQYNYNYFYRLGSLSTKKSPAIVSSLVASFAYIREHLTDRFSGACEYIGVRNVLYGAVLNAFQSGMNIRYVKAIVTDFEKNYPTWPQSRYIPLLPLRKRIFLKLVQYRNFLLVKAFCTIHTLCLKTGIG